jgi:hypothetical protein
MKSFWVVFQACCHYQKVFVLNSFERDIILESTNKIFRWSINGSRTTSWGPLPETIQWSKLDKRIQTETIFLTQNFEYLHRDIFLIFFIEIKESFEDNLRISVAHSPSSKFQVQQQKSKQTKSSKIKSRIAQMIV